MHLRGWTSLPVIDIPDPLLAALGRFIVTWSTLEWLLAQIEAHILKLGAKEARIALGNPSAQHQLNIIKQLLRVHQIKIEKVAMGQYAKDLKAYQADRDLLAHCIWGRTPEGQLAVRDTSGAWGALSGHGNDLAKKIAPEYIPVDEAFFWKRVQMTLGFIDVAGVLHAEVAEKLPTSKPISLIPQPPPAPPAT